MPLDERLVTASARRPIVTPRANVATILSTPLQRYNLATTLSSSLEGPSNATQTAGSTPTPTTTAMNVRPSAISIQRNRVTMTLAPKKRSKVDRRRGVDQLSWFSSVTVDRDPSVGPVEQDDGDDDDDDDFQAEVENSGSRSRPTSRTPSQSGWSMRSASRLRSSRTRVTNSDDRRSRSTSPMHDDRDPLPPRDLAEEYVPPYPLLMIKGSPLPRVSRVVKRLTGSVQHEKVLYCRTSGRFDMYFSMPPPFILCRQRQTSRRSAPSRSMVLGE